MRPIVDVDPWRSLALAIATSEQRQRLLNCHAYLHTRNPFAGHSDRVPARNRWPNDAHRAHLSGKRAGIEQGEADASAVVVEPPPVTVRSGGPMTETRSCWRVPSRTPSAVAYSVQEFEPFASTEIQTTLPVIESNCTQSPIAFHV